MSCGGDCNNCDHQSGCGLGRLLGPAWDYLVVNTSDEQQLERERVLARSFSAATAGNVEITNGANRRIVIPVAAGQTVFGYVRRFHAQLTTATGLVAYL